MMKKLMSKKANIFGKKIPVFVIALIAVMGLAAAALIPYFGLITGHVTVSQGLLVDGLAMPTSGNIVETWNGEEFTSLEEKTFVSVHELDNQADVDAEVQLDSLCETGVPNGVADDCVGITTTYLKEKSYTFDETIPVNDGSVGDLKVTVTDEGDWMVWTFDFPVEQFTGDGNLNVGLIIALDGEGQGPAFQIHNNDGATAEFPHGTWLMSPWGPTISDGWNGWSSVNTPVTDLSWVEATGNRKGQGTDGILQIKILKSVLGKSFHWATSPTVGSGFYAPAYDVTMQIPTVFSWSNPIVSDTNYVYAELMEKLTNPLTISTGTTLNFVIVNEFQKMLVPDTYTITTTVKPVEPVTSE